VGLREQAEADLGFMLEDTEGFGWPITITNPAGAEQELTGLSTDVALAIDPETGQAVLGRTASVALRMSTLESGLGVPVGISEKGSKPWRVTFDDIGGTAHTFKVTEVRPDRTVGVVTCQLQVYQQ
jgi:hypothetical protein